MTQTSDILEAIRTAGIPLNTTQLAEQLPHIPKPSISAACSQLRQQGVLTGTVEDGRLHFQVIAGAGPSDTYKTHVDDEAGNVDDDDPAGPVEEPVTEGAKHADVDPAAEKPPTQSFSPTGMDIHAVAPMGVESEATDLPVDVRMANMRRREADAADRHLAPEAFNSARMAQAEVAGILRGPPRPPRNDGRLCRELAAAVLARWPGEIPYDVQRLVNSAATLPL